MLNSQSTIDALQFDLSGLADQTINRSNDPAYSFTFQFANGTAPSDQWAGFTGWTAMSLAERDVVRAAFAHVETFLNVDFTEIFGAGDPDINLGKVYLPGSTVGYGGLSYTYYGNGSLASYDSFAVYDNSIDFVGREGVIYHEIGHALGLDHPFDGGATLPAQYDNAKYTVMSYDDSPDTGEDADAMMLLDVLALQDRWGANMSHNTGNDSYTGPRNTSVDVIWDAGGLDTLDASAFSTSVLLDLREGMFSQFHGRDDAVVAYGVDIEDAFGGDGADQLIGNDLANLLNGGAGDDVLSGGGGNDTLIGDTGADAMDGGAGIDTVSYESSTGSLLVDLLFYSVNTNVAAGDSYTSIENLTGSQGFDNLRGTFGDNVIRGMANVDYIYGRQGNDTLEGGVGDDVLFGGPGADTLDGGANRDRAQYSESLSALVLDLMNPGLNTGEAAGDIYISIEDLAGSEHSDTISGDLGANQLFGRAGDDNLYGRAGNDYLNGGAGSDRLDGGAGDDTLRGGQNADTFVFDTGADVVEDFSFAHGDQIAIDKALTGGVVLTGAQIVDTYASVVAGEVVFDFGGGNTLTVESLSSLTGLEDDVFAF